MQGESLNSNVLFLYKRESHTEKIIFLLWFYFKTASTKKNLSIKEMVYLKV